jgi:hypothetical protein
MAMRSDSAGIDVQRCGYRDPETRKKLGASCPKLPDERGKRRPLRRGSFDSQDAAQDELNQVRGLLTIPDEDDQQALAQVTKGAPRATRTHTGRILSPLPLPIGLGGPVRSRCSVPGRSRRAVRW